MKTFTKSILAAATAVFLALNAHAVSFSFEKISANAPDNLSTQLSVDVLPTVNGFSFTFANNVGIPSNIAELYSTSGYNLGTMSISTTGGAVFTSGGTPATLPGMSSLGILADSQGQDGINSASRTVTLTFVSPLSFNTVISALNADTLRLGVHVRSIGTTGNSDAYITDGRDNDVPAPGVPDSGSTLALLGLAVAALAFAKRKL